ncbi:restriction endonuclease subunit S [Winogradskyella bathintestinalis]|uniref:Restriction endonuclease subunit S n=1 Tax=Winogradskyella bathintestinalis TaxID=3035208 RepID=A0ABT7ZWY0_9FLAO|nr:restriction endonuclease subunit S [Winogradskyella bathintestinalis]MDN3493512.1 restriction endonuclease subunit S [Winogradskyella bathintestinalis]
MKVDFNHIPKGWKKVKIAKKLFFQEGPGVRKWQFTDKGIKLLNVGNINNGKVDLAATDKHLSVEEATGKYAHFLVDEGDLLIACSGIVVDNFHNKIAFAKKEHLPLCLNTSTMRFRPLEDDVDLNYFKYYLQTVHFTSQLQKLITGSAQLNFGPSHIKKIDFLFPPLKTQQHIASILDDAAALRDKTAQLLKEYDLLAQSIFLDMFGDVVNNPKNWKTNTIEQLVVNEKGSIKRGPFGGALKKEIFVEQGYLVYEQYHALNNDFNFERYYIDDKNFKRLKGFEVKPGDIIISCSGVYLGKLAIIPKDAKKGIINQALLKVKLDEKKIRKDFFVFHFRQQNFRDKYFGANRGAGIPNFPPMASFKKFPFITPPINLQNQFAEKIYLIEKQKELVKQELQESEDLFNCLLQKAFKGELV